MGRPSKVVPSRGGGLIWAAVADDLCADLPTQANPQAHRAWWVLVIRRRFCFGSFRCVFPVVAPPRAPEREVLDHSWPLLAPGGDFEGMLPPASLGWTRSVLEAADLDKDLELRVGLIWGLSLEISAWRGGHVGVRRRGDVLGAFSVGGR